MTNTAANTLQGSARNGAASGLRTALVETVGAWREMFDRRSAPRNVAAGISTALVALPLNVALALACGLPPSAGLLSGAVAGVIAALFGGARLQVTGPEVALAPLTFAIVSKYGVSGLLAVTFLAGVIQIAFGLLRLGRFVQAVPKPVIGGFMAAVGLMVFNSQVPRLLGLTDVRTLSSLRSVAPLGSAGFGSILVGALAVLALLTMPRVHKRIPAPLVAMGAGVAVVAIGISTPVLTAIPSVMPDVRLPDFGSLPLAALISDALALAVLASLDSLLCAAGMDSKAGGPRTRMEQELVAQGLANMACACVGVMPVAGAIVRSMAAYEAGATTRLAPVVQSVALALVMVLLTPFLPLVPIAALAAILLVVGYRLIDWRGLLHTFAASRSEALIFVATTAAILATDFVIGVGLGLVIAVVNFARKSSRLTVSAREAEVTAADAGAAAKACVVRLEGALFFGSHTDVEHIAVEAEGASVLVINIAGVRQADLTGATSLARVADEIAARHTTVWVVGARAGIRPVLEAAGLKARLLPSEAYALGMVQGARLDVAPESKSESAPESMPESAPEVSAQAHREFAMERRPSRRPPLSNQLQPSLE